MNLLVRGILMMSVCAVFVTASLAQVAPCGGSCGSPITAPICITTSPTNVPVTVISCANGGDLEISVQPAGAGQTAAVTIQVHSPNYIFNDIKVRNPVAGSVVLLTVWGTGSGSISSSRGISQSGGAGELWISTVIAGSIGTGGIQAATINTVRATSGNISGPIVATGSPPGGMGMLGNITNLRAEQGNIFGNVTAPNGNIDAVRALNGTIGSASFTAYIGAKRNIQRVEARQIWANIDARMNGGEPADSHVWRVNASREVWVAMKTTARTSPSRSTRTTPTGSRSSRTGV